MVGADEASADRVGVLRFLTAGLVVMGGLWSVYGFMTGRVFTALVVIFGALLLVANVASVQSGSTRGAAWRLCWVFFAVVTFSSLSQGGLFDASFGWLYLVPILGMLLVGPRAAWVLTGMVLACIVAVSVLLALGFDLPGDEVPALVARRVVVSRVLAVVAIGICLAAMERRDRRIRNALHSANENLRIQVEEQDALHTRLLRAERLATVGELSAMVAHEINNPLSYLVTNLDLLTRFSSSIPTHDRARFEEMLEDAIDGADRVRVIVADLKQSTRDPGLEPMEVFSIAPVVARSIKLVGRMLQDVAIDIAVDEAPAAYGRTGPLVQALVNLFANSAQAMSNLDAQHRLGVCAWGEPEAVVIEITDTGSGIDSQLLGQVFEPFFTTRPGSGTGLGLAVTRSLLESMGGRILAESPEEGARFRLELARADRRHPAVRPGLRILAIDDEPLILAAIQRALPAHDVTVESNSARGLQRALEESWDAILCDLMMPEISGEQLYRQLVSASPEKAARVVFITGAAGSGPQHAFASRPELTILSKPIEMAALEAALAAVSAP